MVIDRIENMINGIVTHEIEVESAAGTAFFKFIHTPSPDNPKTSALTALSLVAALRELLDPEGRP